MKKISSLILALALALGLALTPAQAALNADSSAALTREAFGTALWEREGKPVVNYALSYRDVSEDASYTEAIRWAASARLMGSVGDGAFLPEGTVTREQLATVLYRYAKYLSMDVSVWEDTNILSYDDAFEHSDWAASALQWALGADVLEAKGSRLDARGAVTQADAAAALERFDDLKIHAQLLSSWTADARAKEELKSFMAAITDEDSDSYIPVVDRVAVFDLDGTLFCETDPNYFDYTLLKYRVLEDPSYKDKASDFEKEVANKIKEQNGQVLHRSGG